MVLLTFNFRYIFLFFQNVLNIRMHNKINLALWIGYRLETWGIRFLAGATVCFSTLYRLWWLPSLLCNWYQSSFSSNKVAGTWSWPFSHLVPKIRKRVAIAVPSPTPHMPSWRSQEQRYLIFGVRIMSLFMNYSDPEGLLRSFDNCLLTDTASYARELEFSWTLLWEP